LFEFIPKSKVLTDVIIKFESKKEETYSSELPPDCNWTLLQEKKNTIHQSKFTILKIVINIIVTKACIAFKNLNISDKTIIDEKLIDLLDPTIKHYFESIKLGRSMNSIILQPVTNNLKEDAGVLNFMTPQ